MELLRSQDNGVRGSVRTLLPGYIADFEATLDQELARDTGLDEAVTVEPGYGETTGTWTNGEVAVFSAPGARTYLPVLALW